MRLSYFKQKDLPFRIVAAVCGAHIMVVFGVETTFFQALMNPVYYRAMLGSTLIALPVVEYAGYVSRKLDKKYDWIYAPLERCFFQLLLGVILTSIIAFLLASAYFSVNGINIFDTLYLRFDFPVVVILILLMNMFFVLQYFYRYAHSRLHGTVPAAALHEEKKPKYTETLIVRSGSQSIPVAVTQVCFFFLEGDYRYLQTFDGRKYLVTQTLDELEEALNKEMFFRANRQVIVNRTACIHYNSLDFGKLEVKTNPAFNSPIVVSQKRAKEFKQWIGRYGVRLSR